MPPVGFEPAIPASKRPHTHALDCAATGIGYYKVYIKRDKERKHMKCEVKMQIGPFEDRKKCQYNIKIERD